MQGWTCPMHLRTPPPQGFTLHTFISVVYTKISLCFQFSGQTWYSWHQLLRFRVLHGTTNKQMGFPCDEWFHVKTDTVIHKDWAAVDLVFQVLYEQIWLIPWRLLDLCFGHILTGKHTGYSQGGSNGYQCFFFSFFWYWEFGQI